MLLWLSNFVCWLTFRIHDGIACLQKIDLLVAEDGSRDGFLGLKHSKGGIMRPPLPVDRGRGGVYTSTLQSPLPPMWSLSKTSIFPMGHCTDRQGKTKLSFEQSCVTPKNVSAPSSYRRTQIQANHQLIIIAPVLIYWRLPLHICPSCSCWLPIISSISPVRKEYVVYIHGITYDALKLYRRIVQSS